VLGLDVCLQALSSSPLVRLRPLEADPGEELEQPLSDLAVLAVGGVHQSATQRNCPRQRGWGWYSRWRRTS
jgi:hypothetical protein